MNLGDGFVLWSDFIQIGILLMSIAILYYEAWRMHKRNGRETTEPLLMIFWMMHSIIFYTAVILDDFNLLQLHKDEGYIYTTWSAALRFHGYTSLLVITYLRVNRRKLIRRKAEGILYGSDRDD